MGPDAARLTYLLQSIDSRQVFDLALVAAQKNENPVFYVQYAHARIHSLGRVAARGRASTVDLSMRSTSRRSATSGSSTSCAPWPSCPRWSSWPPGSWLPTRSTTWVRELAGAFHGFYHDCRVMGEGVDPATTQARLWLVEASRVGLQIGLDLLGVSAPTSM